MQILLSMPFHRLNRNPNRLTLGITVDTCRNQGESNCLKPRLQLRRSSALLCHL